MVGINWDKCYLFFLFLFYSILFTFLILPFHVILFEGLKLRDIVRGIIKTQRAPAPDSNIKGRLLTVAEGCGLPKLTSIKRIVGGGPAKNGKWIKTA